MKNSIASTRATESTCSGKRFSPRAADIASAFRAFLSASCTKAAARRLPHREGKFSCAPECADFSLWMAASTEWKGKTARWRRRTIISPRCRRTSCRNCLPAEVVEREPVFLNLRNLRTSPITGVHLWFDRTVMSEPFLTLLDSTTQWVFNKTQLYGGGAKDGGQYLQLVISASYSLASRSRQEIIALCLEELREVLPADSRGHAREGNRRQGNVRDVFAGARVGPVAPRAKKPPFGIISRRGLDIDRLAVHNGGSRPHRLPGRRSNSLRCRNATEIIATGFARGRIRAPVGPRIVSNSPRTVLTRNQRLLRLMNRFA